MSRLADDLRAMGIRNTLEIMKRAEVKVVMFYNTQHPHANGYTDHRISIHFITSKGAHKSRTLRRTELDVSYGTAKENREQFFEGGRKWFNEKLWRGEGTIEWVRDPFTEQGWQWIPKQTHDALMADVKAWRAEQKTTAQSTS
jgi:hypothetical protein